MNDEEQKKVQLDMNELEGKNAFVVISEFKKAARDEMWTDEEIENVVFVAMGGNYHHLIKTLRGVSV